MYLVFTCPELAEGVLSNLRRGRSGKAISRSARESLPAIGMRLRRLQAGDPRIDLPAGRQGFCTISHVALSILVLFLFRILT